MLYLWKIYNCIILWFMISQGDYVALIYWLDSTWRLKPFLPRWNHLRRIENQLFQMILLRTKQTLPVEKASYVNGFFAHPTELFNFATYMHPFPFHSRHGNYQIKHIDLINSVRSKSTKKIDWLWRQLFFFM